ncbi:hypothetical protein SAMN05421636_107135 [Pricia antarctica]|uniref:Uncharacterized protein n=2 Tax=Pricia antarctica TaxID=641691 RepID=A0A1G7FI54_9FLAO|nr:hypothetical protein SAMN05421636_107135 [Pricia antarctica]
MTDAKTLDDFKDPTREDLKAYIAFAADRERKLMTIANDYRFRTSPSR